MHEAAWNATARLADIVLPATTTLERNDIGASSRDSYIFAMQQAIEPVGGARNDAMSLPMTTPTSAALMRRASLPGHETTECRRSH